MKFKVYYLIYKDKYRIGLDYEISRYERDLELWCKELQISIEQVRGFGVREMEV